MREEERDIPIFENEVRVDTFAFSATAFNWYKTGVFSQLLLNLLFDADVLSTTFFCLMMILG